MHSEEAVPVAQAVPPSPLDTVRQIQEQLQQTNDRLHKVDLDAEAVNALIHALLELVNIGIAHAQLDLKRQMRRDKRDKVEAVLSRAFPGGTAELKGPIREVVDLLCEE